MVTRSKMHNLPTFYLLKKKKICRTMTPSPALASSQSEVSATRLRFIAQCSTATSWGIFINFMKILMRIRLVRQRRNPIHEQTNKQKKHENLFLTQNTTYFIDLLSATRIKAIAPPEYLTHLVSKIAQKCLQGVFQLAKNPLC